jgi:hypothetical protein
VRILHLRRSAEVEADEAALWYEARADGLGIAFYRALQSALDAAAREPFRFAVRRAGELRRDGKPYTLEYRAVRLARFPYRATFFVLDDTVHVVAIQHDHRDEPDYDARAAEEG